MPVTLKEQHPYEGNEELILHYAEDEEGNRYIILQKETGNEYDAAVDLYPCRFTYEPTDKKVLDGDAGDSIIEEGNEAE